MLLGNQVSIIMLLGNQVSIILLLGNQVSIFLLLDNQDQTLSVYRDIMEIEELEVVDSLPYFDKGSLKAQLRWTVEEGW